jgi:hypothetical protein
MRTSVEGNTFREDNSSYVPNLSLSGGVLESSLPSSHYLSRKVNEGGRYSSWLIPRAKLTPVDALSLKDFGADYLPGSLSNLSAYVFRHAIEIYSLTSQHTTVSYVFTYSVTRI